MTLSVALNRDLSVFISSKDFGQEVVFTRVNNTTLTVNAVADFEHLMMNEGSNDISGYQPVLNCKTSDILNIEPDDFVKINNKNYRIIDVQPDGTGMSKVILRIIE
jgi:hypothetical protein